MAQRRPRHFGVLLAVLLTAVVALPGGALAVISFSDVPADNPFYNDIQAIADAGVTTGCGGGMYCPKEPVTREQMAAFMNRLGALAADKTPVVNADRLDGRHATDFQLYTLITSHFGPWNLNSAGASGMTLERYVNETQFKAAGAGSSKLAQLDVTTPLTYGTTNYGFKSVEICWSASSNVTLAGILVRDSGTAGSISTIASDTTGYSMTAADCVTVTDAVPGKTDGGVNVLLNFTYSAAGTAKITSTHVTWARVLTLIPLAVDKVQDAPGTSR